MRYFVIIFLLIPHICHALESYYKDGLACRRVVDEIGEESSLEIMIRYFDDTGQNKPSIRKEHLDYLQHYAKTESTKDKAYATALNTIMNRACTQPSTRKAVLAHPYTCEVLLVPIFERALQDEKYLPLCEGIIDAQKTEAGLTTAANLLLKTFNDDQLEITNPISALLKRFSRKYVSHIDHSKLDVNTVSLTMFCHLGKKAALALKLGTTARVADSALIYAQHCIKKESPHYCFLEKLLCLFSKLLLRAHIDRDIDNGQRVAKFFTFFESNKNLLTAPALEAFFATLHTSSDTRAPQKIMAQWARSIDTYKTVINEIFTDENLPHHTQGTSFHPSEILKTLSSSRSSTGSEYWGEHLTELAYSTLVSTEKYKPLYIDALCTYAKNHPDDAAQLAKALTAPDRDIAQCCTHIMLNALERTTNYTAQLHIARKLAAHHAHTYMPLFDKILCAPYTNAQNPQSQIDALIAMHNSYAPDMHQRQSHLVIEKALAYMNVTSHNQTTQIFPTLLDVFQEACAHNTCSPDRLWLIAQALLDDTFDTISETHKITILTSIMNNPEMPLQSAHSAYAEYYNRTHSWKVDVSAHAPCKSAITLLDTLTDVSLPVKDRCEAITHLIADGFPRTLIRRKISIPEIMKDSQQRVLLEHLQKQEKQPLR